MKDDDGLSRGQRYYRRKREEDPTAHAQRIAAWRKANPGRAQSLSRVSYLANIEKRRAYAREYGQRRRMEGQTDQQRLTDRLRKARRKAAANTTAEPLTVNQWLTICASFDHRCAYCGVAAPLEQDHVIPISKGGMHTAGNVVPACKSCNSSKGNRSNRPLVADAGTRGRPVVRVTSRLSEEDVIQIRALRAQHSQSQLAAMFGVGQSTISRILLRQTWGWLP